MDDTLSDSLLVISDIPQGAVCSPLLFLIYINVLLDHILAGILSQWLTVFNYKMLFKLLFPVVNFVVAKV